MDKKLMNAKLGSVAAIEACPQIIEWWDSEKNKGIELSSLTAGSKIKAFFRCPRCSEPMYREIYRFLVKQKDGSYHVPICQQCSPTIRKDRVWLTDAVPDIEKYWDYDRNEGRKPSEISATASDKVYTFCPICGSSVRRNARFTWIKDENGEGHVLHCRTCGKRNVDNSLVVLFPEIKKYWVYEKNEHNPDYYAVTSGQKVYIRCQQCGKERLVAICDAIKKNKDSGYSLAKCKECGLSDALITRRSKQNNIETSCHNIMLYWDERNMFKPSELTLFSLEYIYTHCPSCKTIQYRRAINSFKKVDGTWQVLKCQKCAVSEANRNKSIFEHGSVLMACPEIKEWWDYDKNEVTPDVVSRGSHYEAFYKCPACGISIHRDIHSFISTRRDGRILPVACPECGYSSEGDPDNNILKICPEIEKWWDYEANGRFRPEQFTRGSQFKAYLKCPDCNLSLYTGIHSLLHVDKDGNVVISHSGRCRKYKAMESENNLVRCYPEVKEWWDYEKNYPDLPEEYTLFSPKRVSFKCPKCDTETCRRIVDAFVIGNNGIPMLFSCTYCSGERPIRGINSLAALYPEIAVECISTDDTERILPSSSSRMEWKCTNCGSTWFDLVNNRVNGAGCPYCENRRVLPGYNTFKVRHPDLFETEWAVIENIFIGIDPDDILDTNIQLVWWKCPRCEHLYTMSVKNRLRKQKRGQNPCTFCGGRRIPSPRIIL